MYHRNEFHKTKNVFSSFSRSQFGFRRPFPLFPVSLRSLSFQEKISKTLAFLLVRDLCSS